MPELDFRITDVSAASRGLTPLLNFTVAITSSPQSEPIHSILLQAQIQIQPPRRKYAPVEQEKLVELFGVPAQWGATLRNRTWTTAHCVVSGFAGSTTARISVPCTYDLNVAATKYCYALQQGDVPLLFLFSGTIFYCDTGGRLQVQQISWDKEAPFQMPVSRWQQLMEEHYPNSAWLYLHRDVFDRLYAYKRSQGLATWDQAIEHLLQPRRESEEVCV